MKLEYMMLDNWRSFYGENTIEFSTDSVRNVTLIRAENGVGKTSLLAALNWCLFGILDTEDFENPDKLVNDFALLNDNAYITKVEVEFSHNDKNYKAARTYDQRAKKTGEVRLVYLQNGAEIPLGSSIKPDRLIESIIPREMAPHFFFYGEKTTSKYTGSKGAMQFGKAVKSILGSTVANLAIDDLKKVFTDYSKQAAHSANSEAVKMRDEIQSKQDAIDKADNDLVLQESEEKEADRLIEQLNRQLAGTEQVKEDQKKRAQLEKKLKKFEKDAENQKIKSKGWLSKFGIPLLVNEFSDEIEELLQQKDTKKKIPGPYNESFVNEILKDNECVCGRSFSTGSKEEENIKSLLKNASDEGIISRVLATTTSIGTLKGRSANAWEEYIDNGEKLADLDRELAGLRAEIEEISQKLKNNVISGIADKEEALIGLKRKREIARSQQKGLTIKIGNLDRDRKDLEKREAELLSKSKNAKRYVKRSQFTSDLMSRLYSRLKNEEDDARLFIKLRLDKIIQKFMRKKLTAVIDKDYQLTLLDENKTPAAKSTGENQLLGLAFTGAIAYFAKDRQYDASDILLSGTEAPLVIDSPFGHLDTSYRRGVANFLPELASQIILLVSTSQASDEVLQELEEKVGLQYYLERNEEAKGEGKPEEIININGKSYDLTLYQQAITGTLIKEVIN